MVDKRVPEGKNRCSQRPIREDEARNEEPLRFRVEIHVEQQGYVCYITEVDQVHVVAPSAICEESPDKEVRHKQARVGIDCRVRELPDYVSVQNDDDGAKDVRRFVLGTLEGSRLHHARYASAAFVDLRSDRLDFFDVTNLVYEE